MPPIFQVLQHYTEDGSETGYCIHIGAQALADVNDGDLFINTSTIEPTLLAYVRGKWTTPAETTIWRQRYLAVRNTGRGDGQTIRWQKQWKGAIPPSAIKAFLDHLTKTASPISPSTGQRERTNAPGDSASPSPRKRPRLDRGGTERSRRSEEFNELMDELRMRYQDRDQQIEENEQDLESKENEIIRLQSELDACHTELEELRDIRSKHTLLVEALRFCQDENSALQTTLDTIKNLAARSAQAAAQTKLRELC
ncbi:hypothetical protein DL96DRAFT_1631326 [Flagelloscypha sp. PMI_526]|nr:hypothetical protein DL96DRAFT_1631326 [Flagelloscypha sp. PMI_526]